MTEVALADYLAFCFGEAVRAREMADGYSRQLAERYAADPVLKDFPVPRFRTPSVTFVIPVLVSDARFVQEARFAMEHGEFVELMSARADLVRRRAESGRPGLDVRDRGRLRRRGVGAATAEAVDGFYEELASNPDPARPDDIVTVWWSTVFDRVLEEAQLLDPQEAGPDLRRLRETTTREVLDLVRGKTVVGRTTIESLLVDPVTSTVNRESAGGSVFNVTAELVEEGFQLRTIRDESTGQDRTIVDFE